MAFFINLVFCLNMHPWDVEGGFGSWFLRKLTFLAVSTPADVLHYRCVSRQWKGQVRCHTDTWLHATRRLLDVLYWDRHPSHMFIDGRVFTYGGPSYCDRRKLLLLAEQYYRKRALYGWVGLRAMSYVVPEHTYVLEAQYDEACHRMRAATRYARETTKQWSERYRHLALAFREVRRVCPVFVDFISLNQKKKNQLRRIP